MKLTTLILIIALMQVSAKGFGQKISLNAKNLPIEKILLSIRQQSGYEFIYDVNDIKGQTATVRVVNADVEDALKAALKDLDLTYKILQRNIVLTRKDQTKAPKDTRVQILVTDSLGTPLPGATVTINGNKGSAITDASGTVNISVNEGDVLQVSYLGMKPENLVVDRSMLESKNRTISLKSVSSNLQTVVVSTGYQKISREKMTGSIVTVSSAELEKRNTNNIMSNLEGVVPGLVMYNRNGAPNTIRGQSTLQANTNILVVVDGFPLEGGIATLNPYDIETIDVLKDAAAAAIYGARASNGVIVVTTKKAKQLGKTVVDFSTNITLTQKPDYSYDNLMTPAQQVDWESNYYNWYFNNNPAVTNPVATVEGLYVARGTMMTPIQYAYYQRRKNPSTFTQANLDALLNQYRQNNFVEEFRDNVLEQQLQQQYNVAIRTNAGKSQSNLVLNYTTSNTGIINQFNRALNIFYKGNYSIGNFLDIEYGVNSILGKGRGHSSTIATNPYRVSNYISMFNPDGTRAYYSAGNWDINNTITETRPSLKSLKFNHLDELERDYIKRTSFNSRYYVNLNFKVAKGLTINPMFQYEDNRSGSSAYSETESYTMRFLHNSYTQELMRNGSRVDSTSLPNGGRLIKRDLKSSSYTARAQANYNKKVGKHEISAIGGMEFRETLSNGNGSLYLGYDDQLQTHLTGTVNFDRLARITTSIFQPGTAPVNQRDSITITPESLHRYASGYANFTYTYNGKYNVFGSARKDYADLFGGDERYRGRPLWSVGAAWIASREEFMKNISFIDFLKLRGSFGFTGNIDPTTSAVLTATTTTNTETQLPVATVATPPNNQLRWEKTQTLNAGIDFSMLRGRLSGTLEAYMRKGTDLLANKRLDPSTGFTSLVINNGGMKNTGLELSLNYNWFRNADGRGLSWTTSVNASYNKNKISYVDVPITVPADLTGQTVTATGAFRTDYPVRSLWSFRWAGLDGQGNPMWFDRNGQPSTARINTAADLSALIFSGQTDPKYTAALNNDIRYKGFSLSAYLVYYGGNYQRTQPVPRPVEFATYGAGPLANYLLDAWTPTNTNTVVAGSGQYFRTNPNITNYTFSDFLVRRADFIRLRNVVLGYDLPMGIASKIKASRAQIRFQVNNLPLIWSKQKDVNVDIETGGRPIPTSYVFGLNLNF